MATFYEKLPLKFGIGEDVYVFDKDLQKWIVGVVVDASDEEVDIKWGNIDHPMTYSRTDMEHILSRPEKSPSERYQYCNHHHELTDQHELVDFGDGEFVANKMAVPLLKELNESGLRTRTHHVDHTGGFVSILLDNARVEVKTVNEIDADRTKYNGKYELLIIWDRN